MAAYLDNGILDVLGIQYRLENGFVVNHKKLLPLAFIMFVDEPGHRAAETEGMDGAAIVYAKVHALTMKGKKVWLMSVKDLEQTGIYDNTWVCTMEQGRQLVCWREGTDELIPVSLDLWNNKLEEK